MRIRMRARCASLGAMILILSIAGLAAACQPAAKPTPTKTAAPPSATAGVPTAAPTDTAAPTPSVYTMKTEVSRGVLLDPALAQDADSQMLNGYLYDTLVRLEGDKPVPALALRWTISDDELNYVIDLRPGVKFSDGTPFNADVVLANFNRWFDPENPLHGGRAYPGWEEVFLGYKGETFADGRPKSFFDGIEKVNDYTVMIHLNRPDTGMMAKLARPLFAMVNPAALAAAGTNYGKRDYAISGTGLYTLVEWTETAIRLMPNPAYWDTQASEALEFPLA